MYLPHGFSFRVDLVGIVHQAIQNSISDGWIGDWEIGTIISDKHKGA